MSLRRMLLFCLCGLLAGAAGTPVGAYEEPGPALEDWITALRAEALDRNISQGTLDAALADVQLLERVRQLDRKQPEFELTFAQYLDRVVTQRRVEEGRRKLVEQRELLDEIARRYGVQPRFIVALWGIESDFGRRTGGFSTIDALITLAYEGRRSRFFRGELLDALHVIDEGHVDSNGMLGSWAGALGQPQFMPSSFRSFAVDHDGDSRRDIWESVPDVLASVANYLSSSGWRGNWTWGREVRLPRGFDPALAGRKSARKLDAWQALGVRRIDGRNLPRVDVEASIVLPDGVDGRAFVVYHNFGVLLKWNRSDYFATAVGILADRIATP